MAKIPAPADLLSSARSTAVHLEMRDVYAVDQEDGEFGAWRAGHQGHSTIHPPRSGSKDPALHDHNRLIEQPNSGPQRPGATVPAPGVMPLPVSRSI
jgi:hypothetical protein